MYFPYGYYLPFEKCMDQILILFTETYLLSCLVVIGLVVLEKIFKSCQYVFQFVAIISP